MANTDYRRVTLSANTYDRLKSLKQDANKPELSQMIDRIVEKQFALCDLEIFCLPYSVELFEGTDKHLILCEGKSVSEPLNWEDAYTIAKALNVDSLPFMGSAA